MIQKYLFYKYKRQNDGKYLIKKYRNAEGELKLESGSGDVNGFNIENINDFIRNEYYREAESTKNPSNWIEMQYDVLRKLDFTQAKEGELIIVNYSANKDSKIKIVLLPLTPGYLKLLSKNEGGVDDKVNNTASSNTENAKGQSQVLSLDSKSHNLNKTEEKEEEIRKLKEDLEESKKNEREWNNKKEELESKLSSKIEEIKIYKRENQELKDQKKKLITEKNKLEGDRGKLEAKLKRDVFAEDRNYYFEKQRFANFTLSELVAKIFEISKNDLKNEKISIDRLKKSLENIDNAIERGDKQKVNEIKKELQVEEKDLVQYFLKDIVLKLNGEIQKFSNDILNIAESFNSEIIIPKKGEKLNTQKHSILEEEKDDDIPRGNIVKVKSLGLKYYDEVLQKAKVIISH